jgi:hypothetical protein
MDTKSVRVAVLCLALAAAFVLLFVPDRLEIGGPKRWESGSVRDKVDGFHGRA